MKKTASIILLMLAPVLIFSFASATEDSDEIRISVTADEQTTFDMFQNSQTIKGLKTPYDLTVKTAESKFIFKSVGLTSGLKIKVEKYNKTVLTAEWPIT